MQGGLDVAGLRVVHPFAEGNDVVIAGALQA
jgi:hypothetical protein